MQRRDRSIGQACATWATVAAMGGAAALHLAWAAGSTFPFASRAELNDTVIGKQVSPGPVECIAVAAALGTAGALVARSARGRRIIDRLGAAGVAAVLGTRAAFGFAGRTSVLVPGSESPRFVRMDRFVYSPICALLAAGAVTSAQ